MEKSFNRWLEPAVIVAFVSLLFLVLLYAVDVKIDSVKVEINSVKAEINGVKADINGVKADIDNVRSDIAFLRSDVNRTFDRQSADIKATDKKIDDLKNNLISRKK